MRYPAYKPTGIAWLPEVPRGWEMLHVRELFSERREKVSDVEYEPLSVSRGGIVPQMESVAKSDDGDNRKRVCKGDFVINSRSDRKASSGISPLDGSVSLVNIVLQPRERYVGSYVHYLLKSNDFVEEYYRNGRGIVADLWTTRYSEMKSISLPVPTKEEQAIIASYLDEKTAKIDRLIKLKEREIELLQEKKQTVISTVVTRGLDLNTETTLWPLKHITTKIGSGKTPSGGANVYVSTGVMFIRSQNVYYNEIRTDDISCITENVDAEMAGTRVKKGDVLLNITGGSIGRCACFNLDIRANVNQHVCIVRPNRNIVESEYLAAVIFSDVVQSQILQCQNAGNRESLNFDQIARFRIPLPPLEEQRKIVAYLDTETAKTDKAIDAVARQIALLKEYRTRLISDAVTGRIDLREAMA